MSPPPGSGLNQGDVNVQTGGLREFALRTRTMMTFDNTTPTLTRSACTDANLAGGALFKQADEQAIWAVMHLLTRAEQMINGIGVAANNMADRYDGLDLSIQDAFAKIAKDHNLQDVAPREKALTVVDPDLGRALQDNTAPPPGPN